ncbi:hypothetical protein BDZ85DRAFT_249655 [Elsinoe ampelina]|uniref:BTB domain-containing protein n=1 Tax=Elsinoe ampelina TaxID=302913 RepID=A0A6A6GDH9_9PEZI|nr:hypothetical protein BDZ85DRAFT_249655 [Elsinoe ampelina]
MWRPRVQLPQWHRPDNKGPVERPGLPSKNAAVDYSQSLFGDIVTVLVGPTQTKFCVSSIVLKHSSPFFEAALSSNWDRNQSGIIELPEETPIAFEVFLRHAMASQCVPNLHEIPPSRPKVGVLTLASKFTFWLTSKRIFEDTREECPMQNLVADWICVRDGEVDALNLIMQHIPGAVKAVQMAKSKTLFPMRAYTHKERGLWSMRCYWEHGEDRLTGRRIGCVNPAISLQDIAGF